MTAEILIIILQSILIVFIQFYPFKKSGSKKFRETYIYNIFSDDNNGNNHSKSDNRVLLFI